MESAISSRDSSENFMPSWFMLMPSDTEIVENSRGVPPASAIPVFAASTWKSWVMLQGVCSPFMLTTPTKGFAIAASSSPIARMKARCGARSSPSVVTRDRSFVMFASVPASARLLQRSDDIRVPELRDIQLGQHSGLRIDVQHLLDRVEIRRGTRVAAEIIVLQQIAVEHRDRRLDYLGHHLQRLLAIGQRLLHAAGDVSHIG